MRLYAKFGNMKLGNVKLGDVKLGGVKLGIQLAYGIYDNIFDSIETSKYGHYPAFLGGICANLFVVNRSGTDVSEYPLYIHNDHFYALIKTSNRHVYAKFIYPEHLKKLDIDKLIEC